MASFVSRSGLIVSIRTTSSTAAMVGVGDSFSIPFFFCVEDAYIWGWKRACARMIFVHYDNDIKKAHSK